MQKIFNMTVPLRLLFSFLYLMFMLGFMSSAYAFGDVQILSNPSHHIYVASLDSDHDGIPNSEDDDDDGDGIDDAYDDDRDGDGYSDEDEIAAGSDPDDEDDTPLDGDTDGVSNAVDAFPLDPAASVDTDGDGFPDAWNAGMTGANSTTVPPLALDAFPLDPAASVDTDGDGFPDAWNVGMTGANSTTVPPLALDAFPLDPAASVDTDGDGFPDAWNVGMTAANSTTVPPLAVDAFPLDPLFWIADSDGDGVLDNVDAFPLDAAASVDADGDGFPDAWNVDATPAQIAASALVIDVFPTNALEWADLDGDGIGDNSDPDIDGDGVLNAADAFPRDQFRSVILPVITITSPATLTTIAASPILVTGTVDDVTAIVTLNGAVVTVGAGGNFQASVSVVEGNNTIVARAVSTAGNESTDSISLYLDQTPPHMTITYPADGAVVRTALLSVGGLVNDIVRGTVSATQANVTVNGISGTVSNRSYVVDNVPLVAGLNTITVTGSDQVGNIGIATISVTYNPVSGAVIEPVSGQGQSANIITPLAQPFVVRLLDAAGAAAANRDVVFRVVQGNGKLALPLDAALNLFAKPALVASTDAYGFASANFQLGSRAGNGNQRVRATAVGFDGEVLFAASALPNPGNKISVNSGNNQRAAAGQSLGLPLVAVITDVGGNVVAGSNVVFTVTKGGGLFDNGTNTITAVTDSDGRASARFKVGFQPGMDIHRVRATIAGTALSATFTASALVPGAAGNTSISGVVLDNQDNPIQGVTIRVDGILRTGVTDVYGQFSITQVPVGPVHLIAEGATAVTPGEWPTLSQNIITIAGANNTLAAPIYMVKLDTANAVTVGATDVDYTLSSIPGFKLHVKAGSVTFPDGSKTGQLSVTAVNASKVPMAPPNGMQPQLIVTIQPVGAVFDPPAPLTLPNVDGHAPGSEVEMYSFDHDLEEFVAIGLGTVSADGSVIESNPGVGVVKAGWHCGSQPDEACDTCGGCDTCQECGPDGCTSIPGTKAITPCVQCVNGSVQALTVDLGCQVCKGLSGTVDKLTGVTVTTLPAKGADGSVLVQPNATVTFTATAQADATCTTKTYTWTFDDGTTATGPSVAKAFANVGSHPVQVAVLCNGCSTPVTDTVVVKVDPIKNIVATTIGSNIPVVASVTFAANTQHPFVPNQSGAAGLHLPIFYNEAVLNPLGSPPFTLRNFSVELVVNTTDPALTEADVGGVWTVEGLYGAAQPTLTRIADFKQKLTGLTQGGLYKVKFTTDFGVTEANISLPYAGAEIDSIVATDLLRADNFVTAANPHMILTLAVSPAALAVRIINWFGDPNGNYLGRLDNVTSPTVRKYNAVSNATGEGAIVTWNGIPIRGAKASNFLFGYVVYKSILSTVPGIDWFANVPIGTSNDDSARESYNAGARIGDGVSTYSAEISVLSRNLYRLDATPKPRKLWPNPVVPDNYVPDKALWINPDTQYTSPAYTNSGFLLLQP